MADHRSFSNRLRKTLYYGEFADASLPSDPVTDVAVEVLNSAVPNKRRRLDRKYAHSVARRAKISPCALMMGLLYAERLRLKPTTSSKDLSSSDVFLISVMVASKYLYDEGEDEEVFNDEWAKAGLRTVRDINKLEREFLDLMDWNLFISPQEFSNFVNKIESQVAVTKGLSRGWLTYSDVETLLNNKKLMESLSALAYDLLNIMSACFTAYVLSLSLLVSTSTFAKLESNYLIDPNLTTMAHPTVNCLTSVASCMFYPPSTPTLDSGMHISIAASRLRSNNVKTVNVEVSLESERDHYEAPPPLDYQLERAQGTSITLPAFSNFTITLAYLTRLAKDNPFTAYDHHKHVGKGASTKFEGRGEGLARKQMLGTSLKTTVNLTNSLYKCSRNQLACVS